MFQDKRVVKCLIFIALISTISAGATAYFIYNKTKYGEFAFLIPPFLNMIVAIIGALAIFKKKENENE